MATLDSYYAAVNSLGNYVSATSGVTTSTATIDNSIGWQGYYQPSQIVNIGGIGQLGAGLIGGALGGYPYQQQMQVQQEVNYDVPKPKKTFSRVLDALRSEIKEWCGDALMMA